MGGLKHKRITTHSYKEKLGMQQFSCLKKELISLDSTHSPITSFFSKYIKYNSRFWIVITRFHAGGNHIEYLEMSILKGQSLNCSFLLNS